MPNLTLKQRGLLSEIFGLEQEALSLQELAERRNTTPQNVRALERRALRRIDVRRRRITRRVSPIIPCKAGEPLTSKEKCILKTLWGIDDGILKEYLVTAFLCDATFEEVFCAETKALFTSRSES